MKDITVITCPTCGEEYLPGEIFIPEVFFGRQTEIVKSPAGKIEFYLGSDPNFDEEYICDNCGSKLKIHANLTFNVEAVPDAFEEEYVTEINKPKKITLKEEPIF